MQLEQRLLLLLLPRAGSVPGFPLRRNLQGTKGGDSRGSPRGRRAPGARSSAPGRIHGDTVGKRDFSCKAGRTKNRAPDRRPLRAPFPRGRLEAGGPCSNRLCGTDEKRRLPVPRRAPRWGRRSVRPRSSPESRREGAPARGRTTPETKMAAPGLPVRGLFRPSRDLPLPARPNGAALAWPVAARPLSGGGGGGGGAAQVRVEGRGGSPLVGRRRRPRDWTGRCPSPPTQPLEGGGRGEGGPSGRPGGRRVAGSPRSPQGRTGAVGAGREGWSAGRLRALSEARFRGRPQPAGRPGRKRRHGEGLCGEPSQGRAGALGATAGSAPELLCAAPPRALRGAWARWGRAASLAGRFPMEEEEELVHGDGRQDAPPGSLGPFALVPGDSGQKERLPFRSCQQPAGFPATWFQGKLEAAVTGEASWLSPAVTRGAPGSKWPGGFEQAGRGLAFPFQQPIPGAPLKAQVDGSLPPPGHAKCFWDPAVSSSVCQVVPGWLSENQRPSGARNVVLTPDGCSLPAPLATIDGGRAPSLNCGASPSQQLFSICPQTSG